MAEKPRFLLLAAGLMAGLLFPGCGDPEAERLSSVTPDVPPDVAQNPPEPESVEVVEIASYQDVLDLFQTLNYTPEAWQAGIREVPRVYITEISERWRTRTTKEITVLLKKQLFFRALAPLVLRSNERILEDRERLGELSGADATSLSPEDTAWIQELAAGYDVIESDDIPVSAEDLQELRRRVDIIPVALALSQAAEESGWATSRFASQGNALYGQWTWGEHAMKPEQQRAKLGNYGLRAFETPLESVMAYMLNLNSHRAYAEVRAIRAAARARGEEPRGWDMAAGLTRYSERGEAYVAGLRSIMKFNRLDAADDAYLSDTSAIYLVPAAELETEDPTVSQNASPR